MAELFNGTKNATSVLNRIPPIEYETGLFHFCMEMLPFKQNRTSFIITVLNIEVVVKALILISLCLFSID